MKPPLRSGQLRKPPHQPHPVRREDLPTWRKGHPHKLTDLMLEGIVMRVEKGMSVSAAGYAEGVSTKTISEWMARGRDKVTSTGAPAPDDVLTQLCEELFMRVQQARELGVQHHLDNIAHCATVEADAVYSESGKLLRSESKRDWKASAKWLKLVAPERFRDNVAVEHSGGIRSDPDIERRIADDPELSEAVADIYDRLHDTDPDAVDG